MAKDGRITVKLTPVQMAVIWYHMQNVVEDDFNEVENAAILELIQFTKPHVPKGYILGVGSKTRWDV